MIQWFNEDFISSPVMWALLACLVIQLLAWWWQKITQNADIVDMAWTLGIIVSAIIYMSMISSWFSHKILIVLFPVLWYSRLLWHLLRRYEVEYEDSRYQNLRAHWSAYTQIKFLMFFIFQALLSLVFSLPAFWVLSVNTIYFWQICVAVIIGLSALVGVTIADHQLLTFKKENPANKVCNVGLWRYSRHPNYFFEWVHWLVYPILLLNSDFFWNAVAVTLMMLLFLMKLTGIPFSEQQAIKKRGDAYKKYMKQTSQFIPWDYKK